MRKLAWILGGFLAGIAFVLACETATSPGSGDAGSIADLMSGTDIGAGGDAQAAPTDCERWRVTRYRGAIDSDLMGGNESLPDGQEPFAIYRDADAPSFVYLWVRFCAP